MMPRARTALLAFSFSLAFLLLVPGGQAAEDRGDPLLVDDRVSVAGSAETTVRDEGVLHYSNERLPGSFELHAERLVVDHAWETGTVVGPPTQGDVYETTVDQGEHTEVHRNASLTLEPFQASPELLLYPADAGDAEHDLRAWGTGFHSYGPAETPTLTRVGMSPGSEATNDSRSIGFWYQPDPAWMRESGADEATARGGFSLFVNNVTATVEQDGETVWQNWTGYREEDTGPAATSYERHLLKVHVTNATLTLAEDDGISTLGPLLDVRADGILLAETANGHLDLADATFAFDDEPLQMDGEGRFQVRQPSTGPTGELALAVEEGSRFDVQSGQRLDDGLDIAGGLPDGPLWVPLALLGLAVASVAVHRAGYARQALERWRSERYTKWMTRGRELANAADYSQAATCFRRATRAQPVQGVAWYHLAIALLEDDRPREMLDVVDEAREGEAIIDELDFLDIEAQAAHRICDHERCRDAVEQLADGSEAMARTLVRDLRLSEELLGHELATRLSREEDTGDREGLPGYV